MALISVVNDPGKELSDTFLAYARYNGRALPLLIEQLADKLAVDCYLEAAELRGAQKAKIDALPKTFGYRIKRREIGELFQANEFRVLKRGKRKGQYKLNSVRATSVRNAAQQGHEHVSIADEIKLRKRWAGIYQASGWLSDRTKRVLRKAVKFKHGAVVVQRYENTQFFVSVTNNRKGAGEYAEKTGYLQRAFQRRINDMRGYIQRKMNGDAAEFRKAKPQFTEAQARAAVERAMEGKAA